MNEIVFFGETTVCNMIGERETLCLLLEFDYVISPNRPPDECSANVVVLVKCPDWSWLSEFFWTKPECLPSL